MKKLILSLLLIINLAFSKNWEDGIKIYENGDYARVFKSIEKSCDDGNKESCNELAFIYLNEEIRIDYSKVPQYFQKRAAEFMYINVLGKMKKDYPKILGYFQKACELENAKSCAKLGNMYSDGQGVVKNPKKAKELYKKAIKLHEKSCNDNDAKHCYKLAQIYSQDSHDIKKDSIKEKKLLKKACDLGFQASCDQYDHYVK